MNDRNGQFKNPKESCPTPPRKTTYQAPGPVCLGLGSQDCYSPRLHPKAAPASKHTSNCQALVFWGPPVFMIPLGCLPPTVPACHCSFFNPSLEPKTGSILLCPLLPLCNCESPFILIFFHHGQEIKTSSLVLCPTYLLTRTKCLCHFFPSPRLKKGLPPGCFFYLLFR